MTKKYVTKDSGKRQNYDSGMRRDTQEGKPRFDLLEALCMPYEERILTRWGRLMERGAEKYGSRNWEQADSKEELERFRASLYRHFMQYFAGEEDEDHMTAVLFNLNAVETLKYKLREKVE